MSYIDRVRLKNPGRYSCGVHLLIHTLKYTCNRDTHNITYVLKSNLVHKTARLKYKDLVWLQMSNGNDLLILPSLYSSHWGFTINKYFLSKYIKNTMRTKKTLVFPCLCIKAFGTFQFRGLTVLSIFV